MRYGRIPLALFVAGALFFPSVLSAQPVEEAVPPPAEGSVRLPSTESPPERPAEAVAPPAAEAPASGAADMVYLNVQDQDIKDIIKQISKATGKNFIIDEKVRGKVTIISEKTMTREEAYQAFLSALEVAGFTVVTGPAGIIKIVALRDAVSSPIPIHVDATPFTDSYVTRLIKLQNISALDMSNAIKGLISKSGNLFAYPATNTLIITDSGTNIDRLMKIIKELDQEGPQQMIEIIKLKYADAKVVANTVLSLFESGQAQGRRAPARGGAQLEEVEDVSKIIADDRTNSLIVLASKRAVPKLREIIARLDTPLDVGASGSIHVHYLKYANAKDLAATISSVTSGGAVPRTTTPRTPAAGGAQQGAQPTVAQLEGGINIGADESTNSLIITASAKDYSLIVDELISKLDIPRRQVYLESMIMELAMTKGGRYGMRGFSGLGFGPALGFGQTFAATGGLSSIFQEQGLVGGVIGRDTVTVRVPTTSGGTTSSQEVQIPAFAAFLTLLQSTTDANIVSSPNILTLDNEEAEINITSKIYANKVTTIATGVSTTEPTPLESGLILKLKPQISEGESVRLKIDQELSNFTGPPNSSGAAPSTKRKVSTTVITQDGETIVLGGLMQDNVVNSKEKIPILGDIPLLGFLFRNTNTQTSKSNLLIFITPHVIRDPADFTRVMQRKIEQRNRFIDDNYGTRQRRTIRDTLAKHREDLLEFVPKPVAAVTPAVVPEEPKKTPEQKKDVKEDKKSKTEEKAEPAPKVITVPSVDSPRREEKLSSSSGSTLRPPPAPYEERKLPPATPPGELDLAY